MVHEAMPSVTSTAAIQRRASSTIRREERHGQFVYVKRYVEGDQLRPWDVVQARTAREAELVTRAAALHAMRRRLGVPRIVYCDPAAAELVTAEIAGRPLDELLRGSMRGMRSGECRRALFLAGRWLRAFQMLAVRDGDRRRITRGDDDLVEYCAARIEAVARHGYPWPGRGRATQILNPLRHLRRQADGADRRLVWAHHDYGPFNVMWDGRRLTAIDFAMCELDYPLADVTNFVHRLEMLGLQSPWRCCPIAAWRRAFLRGYGRAGAAASPMYRALMIRHLLCRLQSLVRRPATSWRATCHNAWLRAAVRRKLTAIAELD